MRRTLRKYGSLDRYLLYASKNSIATSQLAVALRRLLREKLRNPDFILPNLTCFRKKPRRQKYYKKCAIPPIYIAPELMKNPAVQFIKYDVNQLSRLEENKIEELKKQLNEESDTSKRYELREQIDSPSKRDEAYLKAQILNLQKFRHETFKRYLMKYEQTYEIKQNLIRTFEKSESDLREILGKEYKHYSEDFPEVQLILQKAELQRQKKTMRFMNSFFKNPTHEVGQLAEKENKFENVLSVRGNEMVRPQLKYHRQKQAKEKKLKIFRLSKRTK